MRLLVSIVFATALVGMMDDTAAQAQTRSGGRYSGGTCNCMPMRSHYLYGYANPGYYPGGGYPGTGYYPGGGYYPYGMGVPYTAPAYPAAAMAPPIPYAGSGACSGGDCGYGSDDMLATAMRSVSSLPTSGTDTAASQSSGVSVDGSRLSWPVGLRVLAPTDVGGLRQQVQDLFEAMAAQKAAGGRVNSQVAAEARHALDRLQRLVNRDKQKAGLPQAVNQEAERFVARLRSALDKLQQA